MRWPKHFDHMLRLQACDFGDKSKQGSNWVQVYLRKRAGGACAKRVLGSIDLGPIAAKSG